MIMICLYVIFGFIRERFFEKDKVIEVESTLSLFRLRARVSACSE